MQKESNNWNTNQYKNHASFVSDMAEDLVEVLNPKKDETILDLGCGDGTLALKIKQKCQNIIAVDLSNEMVEKTKSLGIEAYIMSATNLEFENKFDAVFSNAVLHWVKQSKLAVQNINKVLKQNGRFIAEFGGYKNINTIVQAIQEVFNQNKDYGVFNNPWYFPTTQEYKNILEQNGFEVKSINLTTRPTSVDDISNWLNIFANGIISHLNKEQKESFLLEVKCILENKLYTKEQGWILDYVRIRVEAKKII
jgi:2-isopropylmalate synthase